jgi:dTDP-4-amino-4,6-dideoxygalactose transaminase
MPVAERACATVLSLPIFPELSDAQVDHVISAVNAF